MARPRTVTGARQPPPPPPPKSIDQDESLTPNDSAIIHRHAPAAQRILASSLRVGVVLTDEVRARRAAHNAGLPVALLERGARLKIVADLRSVYLNLLDQGIRFDHKLLDQSFARLGLAKLKP